MDDPAMKRYTLYYVHRSNRRLRWDDYETEDAAVAAGRGLGVDFEFWSIIGPTHAITDLRPMVRRARI